MAHFSCQVNRSDVKVKWTLNDQILSADENIIINADNDIRTLKIKKCELSDNGTVSCHIGNKATTTAKLKVEGTL